MTKEQMDALAYAEGYAHGMCPWITRDVRVPAVVVAGKGNEGRYKIKYWADKDVTIMLEWRIEYGGVPKVKEMWVGGHRVK